METNQGGSSGAPAGSGTSGGGPRTVTVAVPDFLRAPAGGSPVKSFFLFDWMVTPILIRVVYVLASLGVIVGALRTMFSKSPAEEMAAAFGQLGGRRVSDGGGNFWEGLFYLVAGLITVRVVCELLIILFRMHENLTAVRDRLK